METKLCCALVAFILGVTINCSIHAIPLSNVSTEKNVSTSVIPLGGIDIDDTSMEKNSTNGTKKDLYVIKAVVYEIGILTEAKENSTEEDDDDDNYSHERVDLTFFDAKSNGSHFDLGNIPLPVQTNVSGQVLTGIAPISLGSIQNASDILSTLPLTGTIINITHSDTSLITLSHRPSISENGTILHQEDIAKIPGINGTTTFFLENTDQGGDSEEPEDVSDDVPDKKTPKPKSV